MSRETTDDHEERVPGVPLSNWVRIVDVPGVARKR